MTHAALSPLIEPEFDKFLGASISEDRNGPGLSVLSAFARLNVDPWQERQTSLARMPSDAAAARLTELIDALPRRRRTPSPQGEPPPISSRCCRRARLSTFALWIAHLRQGARARRRFSWHWAHSF